MRQIPLEPLFVDREGELDRLGRVLEGLPHGRREHVGLLGLRRIGKSMLLDEVRRRHATSAIAYVALDEVVANPEDFARAVVSETLRAALAGTGRPRAVPETDDGLRAAALELDAGLPPAVDDIVDRLGGARSYGALLAATMRFPGDVSRALDCPLLVMLDEFQDIERLTGFVDTPNLLGTVRAALDRRGKVAYVVAGSRVTAMRKLLDDGDSPLFTRFQPLELRPFAEGATHELAGRVWDHNELTVDPNAPQRLHRLTAGWPFHAHAVAARAREVALAADGRVTYDAVDLAFQYELIARGGNVATQCRYLLDTALRAAADGLRNTQEAVLRHAARDRVITRSRLVKRLARHHNRRQVHRAINNLIDNDFLVEDAGDIVVADPVFGLWLSVERERRNPLQVLGRPDAVKRLLSYYQVQHQQDRTEMGPLFEHRIANLVRQFRGQTVPGRLFGLGGDVVLPTVSDASKVRLDDPRGQYGPAPDSYELDVATTGATPADTWAIEAKHRRGAITRKMVERFLLGVRAVERAHIVRFARLWIVAPRGIRADAKDLADAEGILSSGMRDVKALEDAVFVPFSVPPDPST